MKRQQPLRPQWHERATRAEINEVEAIDKLIANLRMRRGTITNRVNMRTRVWADHHSERRAREAKWKALGSRGAASPDKVEVLEDEYAKFIEATYRNTPGAAQMPAGKATAAASPASTSAISSGPVVRAAGTPAGGAAAGTGGSQKPTVTEMEEQLLATIDLAPEAIRQLAAERAEVVRARIVESAQVDPARLFLVEGSERAKKEGGRRVYFTLK